MKLLGVSNQSVFIASVSHHDYVTYDELMCDGGQPALQQYAGYTRASGPMIWAEVSQTWEEILNDYLHNRPRKYGIWQIKDVKLLASDEVPEINSVEWRKSHLLWGTRGKNQDQLLKYVPLVKLTTDHLKAILDTQTQITDELKGWIKEILQERKGSED
ncbi:MAG: hypothetical protein WC390_06630 [Sulfurimonas sp.]|jgi:hypothetical protein